MLTSKCTREAFSDFTYFSTRCCCWWGKIRRWMLCNYTWGGRKAIKGWVKDFFPFAVEMNAKKIVIKTMLMYCERKLEVSEAENSSRLILKLFLTHIFWFFQVWRDPRYIHSPPHNIHILCWVLRWQQRPGTHLQCIRQRRVLGVRTPRRCQSTRYRGKTFDCFWILNNSYRHI